MRAVCAMSAPLAAGCEGISSTLIPGFG
jgi:hypothetical protein